MNPDPQTKFIALTQEYLGLIEEGLAAAPGESTPGSIREPYLYLLGGGGKRVRPILAMLAAGVCGGDPKAAKDAGVAIEIMHNFTLVHDDIMDNSPMRRGNPTLHMKWDSATAILAGDIMVGFAYRLLCSGYARHERFRDIICTFNDGLVDVCEGQALDLEFRERGPVSMTDYLIMIEKKTACLLEMSAAIGGLIAGADDGKIEALKNFARSLGIAFQIQDDLLDFTADRAEFGKSIGQDIIEGKKTYLIVRAWEKTTENLDKQLLEEFFEKKGLPQEYLPNMKELFERNTVFGDAEIEIQRHLNSAYESLLQLPSDEYRAMLGEFTKMLSVRRS